jgi:hypothetical protein
MQQCLALWSSPYGSHSHKIIILYVTYVFAYWINMININQ